MNKRIKELAEQAGLPCNGTPDSWEQDAIARFTELIVRQCADICMEMSAKCAGLPGDGALAKDCANWIKKDFGIKNQKMIKDKEYTGVVKIYRVTDVFYRVRANSVPQAKKKMIDSAKMEDWDDLVWDDPYAYEIDTVELEVKCSPVNE